MARTNIKTDPDGVIEGYKLSDECRPLLVVMGKIEDLQRELRSFEGVSTASPERALTEAHEMVWSLVEGSFKEQDELQNEPPAKATPDPFSSW